MPGQRKEGQKLITVWLDEDLVAAVQAKAKERDDTITDLVRRTFKRYIRR